MIRKDGALKLIVFLSFGGVLFSGYLSYYELFQGGCSQAIVSCGTSGFTFANLPACVYGFVMYSIIFITALLGYQSRIER